MGVPLGYKPPIRLVPCVRCGKTLERRTHLRSASCFKCQTGRKEGAKAIEMRRIRQQARRYRIVLHVLGWEESQFEEMLSEMRGSPMCFRKRPETRAARYDLHTERRAQ